MEKRGAGDSTGGKEAGEDGCWAGTETKRLREETDSGGGNHVDAEFMRRGKQGGQCRGAGQPRACNVIRDTPGGGGQ